MKKYNNVFQLIRELSGIFNDDKNEMSTRLYYCCLLARYKLGDVEKEDLDAMLAEIGIELDEDK